MVYPAAHRPEAIKLALNSPSTIVWEDKFKPCERTNCCVETKDGEEEAKLVMRHFANMEQKGARSPWAMHGAAAECKWGFFIRSCAFGHILQIKSQRATHTPQPLIY